MAFLASSLLAAYCMLLTDVNGEDSTAANVLVSKSGAQVRCAWQGEGGASFKAAKARQQREGAGNRAAWNALFMRPDTVAQAIAAHYKVSKAELLSRDAAGEAPSCIFAHRPDLDPELKCCLAEYCCRPMCM